jgi:hypothetical protein
MVVNIRKKADLDGLFRLDLLRERGPGNGGQCGGGQEITAGKKRHLNPP